MKQIFTLLFLTTFWFTGWNQGGVNDSHFNAVDNGLFGSGKEFNGSEVTSSVIQPDGKIIAVGDLIEYNDRPIHNIVRINPDGSYDESFQPGSGFEYGVKHVGIQADGKIIVSGSLFSYNGTPVKGIVRLLANGSLDTTFTCGINLTANSTIYTFVIQPDNKIIVGGLFFNQNNTVAQSLARLNADGSIDSTFQIPTNIPDRINCMELQADGKLLAGGVFSTINNPPNGKSIFRLLQDGTLDNTFFCDTIKSSVSAIKIQPDGKILVGGYFTKTTGSYGNQLIRINSDGTPDPTFNSGTSISVIPFYITPSIPNAIHVQADGKIIVGGSFHYYQGVIAKNLIRLHPDGSRDMSFEISPGFDRYVTSINVQQNGKLIVTGTFWSYNNKQAGGIIQLHENGAHDNSFNPGVGVVGAITKLATQADDKLIAIGEFTEYNGTSVGPIIRLQTNGILDTTFQLDTAVHILPKGVHIQNDGKILVGGLNKIQNGINYPALIRLNADGSLDPSFTITTNLTSTVSMYVPFVQTIQTQPDGKIIVSGNFKTYAGVANNFIARLHANGTLDQSFVYSGTLMTGIIESHDLLPDGKIMIAGNFSKSVARLNANGSVDNTFDAGSGNGNCQVLQVAHQPNGQILVGGCFGIFNNAIHNQGLVRLNPNGSKDTTFHLEPGASDAVNSFKILADGRIVICGVVTSVDGIQTRNFACLTSAGSLDSTFYHGSGFDATVTAITTQSTGDLVLGGAFKTYNNVARTGIARLSACSNHTVQHLTVCDSAVINGVTYTTSGEYIQTLTNAAGCDSIVITKLKVNRTDTTFTEMACTTFTWGVNNQTYTQSGTYTHILPNSLGCDSVLTLNLTIVPFEAVNILNMHVTPSAVSQCSGTLSLDLAGGDHIMMTVDNAFTIPVKKGANYFKDLCPAKYDIKLVGTCKDTVYSQFIIPVDSMFLVNNPFIDSLVKDTVGFNLSNCLLDYSSIDTAYVDSIFTNGNIVHVNWIIVDKNGIHEDTSSYVLNNGPGVYWLQLVLFCPTKSGGSYFGVTEAVYIDSISPVAGISPQTQLTTLHLYPNPTSNEIHVQFEGTELLVRIFDAQGKFIEQHTLLPTDYISMKHLENGLYLLECTNQDSKHTLRVVKQD